MLENEPTIIKRYVATGKLKYVYRHLVQLGDYSQLAAEATECAGEQGHFWELRQALYAAQDQLYQTPDLAGNIAQLAATTPIDMDTYRSCMNDHRYRAAVEADSRASAQDGVRSRPVFDLKGRRLVGAQPLELFTTTLESP